MAPSRPLLDTVARAWQRQGLWVPRASGCLGSGCPAVCLWASGFTSLSYTSLGAPPWVPHPSSPQAPTHLSNPCPGHSAPPGLLPASGGPFSLLPAPAWPVVASAPTTWGEGGNQLSPLGHPSPGAKPWAGVALTGSTTPTAGRAVSPWAAASLPASLAPCVG